MRQRWRRRLQHLETLSGPARPLGVDDLVLHVEHVTLTQAEVRALAHQPQRHGPPESMTDIAVCVVEIEDERPFGRSGVNPPA